MSLTNEWYLNVHCNEMTFWVCTASVTVMQVFKNRSSANFLLIYLREKMFLKKKHFHICCCVKIFFIFWGLKWFCFQCFGAIMHWNMDPSSFIICTFSFYCLCVCFTFAKFQTNPHSNQPCDSWSLWLTQLWLKTAFFFCDVICISYYRCVWCGVVCLDTLTV